MFLECLMSEIPRMRQDDRKKKEILSNPRRHHKVFRSREQHSATGKTLSACPGSTMPARILAVMPLLMAHCLVTEADGVPLHHSTRKAARTFK